MRSPRLAALALVCLLGVAGLTAVAGAPPPTQLCGSCASDVPGATGTGTLDIYVDADGDSEWVERVPVTESAADRYREDPDALERTIDDAWNDSYRILVEQSGEEIDRDERLENGTITVTYAIDDVARPGLGDAWLVDYFAMERGNDRYGLVAERVTIHTPDGTVVTNDPRYATVEGNAVTWPGNDDGSRWNGNFDRRTYVVYGSSGAIGTVGGYATLGLEIVPTALVEGALEGVLPGLVVGLAGVAVGRVDPGRDAFDAAFLERLLVGVGAVGAVGLLVASAAATGHPLFPGLGTLSVLGVGYAALAIAVRRRRERADGDVLGAGALVGLAVLAAFGAGTLLWLLGDPTFAAILPIGLATALFLPIGYAVERRSTPIVAFLLSAAAALALIAAAAALSWLYSPAGFGVVIYWLLLLWWTGTVVAFGYPLALTGRRLAAAEGR